MAASSQERETTVTKSVAFAALRQRDFRAYLVGRMLSMMADNVEHVISPDPTKMTWPRVVLGQTL